MQPQPELAPRPSIGPGEPQPQDLAELWFEDGNVVIVAGNAAFRVHTGILSRHSEVFQNMFTVPQPAVPASSDVFNGQPVVHVSDSAHDFQQLLGMLPYDGVRFMPPDEPAKFSVLAAVARLGHKYEIEWVLKEAKRRLRSIFAHTYEDWAKRQGHSGNHLVSIHALPYPWIEAINLIRLLGETNMLPVAFYYGSQFPSLLLSDHHKIRVDGTAETLNQPDLERCVVAHTKLIQRQSRLNAEVFCGGPSKRCQSTEVCRTAIEAAYRGVCGSPFLYLSGSPLEDGVLPVLRRLEGEGRICSFCKTSLFERERKGKMAVWRDLPSILGVEVDDWDQQAA